ncbi:MAG: Piwi domain-containing protein [Balneolaceae bacterium]|nr:Piwi domain-containing protein [Balneolaceae bacterium]
MSQSSGLTLNLIPLQGDSKKVFQFYKEKRSDGDVPLEPNEFPEMIDKRHGDSRLYTDFSDEDADITFELSFKDAPFFAKHYLNYRFFEWFRKREEVRMIRTDFVGNLELYFLIKKGKEKNVGVFDCFKVRGGYGRCTDGFECTVIYDGMKQVWLRPVYEYPGETTDIKTVAYDRSLHSYKRLMESGTADTKEVYPVINYKIREILELPGYRKKTGNKIRHYTEKIDWFYNRFIESELFRDEFQPDSSGYWTVPENRVQRLPLSSADLEFGKGVVDRNPFQGLKEGGPYQPPAVAHMELFMIVHESSTKTLGNRLYMDLKKGRASFPGLSAFAKMPLHIRDKNITFKNEDDPLPEIRKALREMELKEHIRYGAIYISPIAKDDPDPARHAVYYRMKEELLKYGITSQTIFRGSIMDSSFNLYLPNIATALVAKMGGRPWSLKQETSKELVIGIGAYRPNKLRKRYLGSAFCFTRNGEFRGFDSFTADDDIKLTGSILKAVRDFHKKNENMERVIIHFYKQMKRREAKELHRKIRELNLDVPLVILTIHKSASRDLILSDRSVSHRLPLSGTWTRIGDRQFLLYNNTRYGLPNDKMKSYHYPLKVRIDIADNYNKEEKWEEYIERLDQKLEEEGWVEELLRQVYQFSRLDWQSVSVTTTPVTVKYPEMVARRFPYFKSETLPEFGKRNLWFL